MSDISLKIDALRHNRSVVAQAAARLKMDGTSNANSAPLTFSVARTLAEMDALEGSWNTLFDRSGKCANLFQSFNWNWHWARIFAAGNDRPTGRQQIAVVTAHSGNKPVLVFPLVEQYQLGVRTLRWMGDPLTQYGDVLLDTNTNREDVLFQAWQYINTVLKPDLVVLRKVRDDATIIPSLRAVDARVTKTSRAPYLDLSDSDNFADYEQRYSAKARKNRRRHRKRLSELGGLESHFLSPGPEAARLVARALTMKRNWVASRNLTSRALFNKRSDQFFLSIAGTSDRPVDCFVSMLTINGRPATIDLAVRNKDRVGAFLSSYDAEYERNSPGSVQLENCLAHCIDNRVKIFDFMAPDDEYKRKWADYAIGVYDFVLPITLKGHAHDRVYVSGIRRGLSLLATRAPKRVRRVVSPIANRLNSK